jgi:protein kinase-like protein
MADGLWLMANGNGSIDHSYQPLAISHCYNRTVSDADVTKAPGSGRTPVTPLTARLAPGAIVAGRYRLVALLGRGGMGEVYRADDLTLDQPIALKFLAEGAVDEAHLAQFHNELRTARQVSHKNVCRLYDLGDAEGRRFLTMEYVDGEDLASLLRRIGRIPQDKAIEIARQLCAGIAAAHERGVLHRDLKPANVMLDGDGNVRITDFGIATAGGETEAAFVGTPQYMAPEQIAGRPASIKTDIYALGLILFEIFTGKRAHDAKTLGDLKQFHDTGTVTTPSSIVRDLDPGVERVILRCVDRDPDKRPASALAVAAALPGGDPLAAALAAGETPSPEVLAAAAETEAFPVLRGLALVAAFLVMIAIYALLSPRATMADLVPLEKPAAVLADRALQILRDFGYADAPADTAENFIIPPDFRLWIVEIDQTVERWNPSRHPMAPGLLFWHRTSPRDMQPNRQSTTVSSTDPPMVVTGQSLVILDTKGRLVEFRVVPPQRDPPASAAPPAPDWSAMFRAAGVDGAAFTPATPEWQPKDFADTRAAWEGPYPDAPDLRIRLEAAAYRGKVSSMFTVGPWARARAMVPLQESRWARVRAIFTTALSLGVIFGSLLLARRNLQASRADRKGAARLAGAYILMQLAAWVVGAHHQSDALAEVDSFFRVAGTLLLQAGILWVLYLALEPFGRRFWPDGLLGWSRLLSGRVRDPRIGREILIGCAFAGALMLVDLLRSLSPLLVGKPPGAPTLGDEVEVLDGFGRLFGTWTDQAFRSLQTTLVIAMLLVVARLLVRRTSMAALLSAAILVPAAGGGVPPGGVVWLYYLTQAMAIGLIIVAIFRYGLLVSAVMIIVDNIPSAVPIVPNGASWASMPGNLSIALVVALACFGFYAARAGQPLLGKIGDMAINAASAEP